MSKEKYISMPKTLTRKRYLEIEKVFNRLGDSLNMTPAELDLYVWYIKTGKILK
jgi:N-glycosylase/DNA lyase